MAVQRLRQALFGIQHNGTGLAQCGKAGVHANGRAQTVQVGKAVAHDEDIIAGGGHFGNGVGHNTGAHLIALFHSAAGAAKKLIAVLLPQRHLVAAAAQGHIQRLAGDGLALMQAGRHGRNTDGHGRVVAVAGIHCPDSI